MKLLRIIYQKWCFLTIGTIFHDILVGMGCLLFWTFGLFFAQQRTFGLFPPFGRAFFWTFGTFAPMEHIEFLAFCTLDNSAISDFQWTSGFWCPLITEFLKFHSLGQRFRSSFHHWNMYISQLWRPETRHIFESIEFFKREIFFGLCDLFFNLGFGICAFRTFGLCSQFGPFYFPMVHIFPIVVLFLDLQTVVRQLLPWKHINHNGDHLHIHIHYGAKSLPISIRIEYKKNANFIFL